MRITRTSPAVARVCLCRQVVTAPATVWPAWARFPHENIIRYGGVAWRRPTRARDTTGTVPKVENPSGSCTSIQPDHSASRVTEENGEGHRRYDICSSMGFMGNRSLPSSDHEATVTGIVSSVAQPAPITQPIGAGVTRCRRYSDVYT